MSRVSIETVRSALGMYLTDDLVDTILGDIVRLDREEADRECGMLYRDWRERFDDDNFSLVWAEDSGAGFGRKGDTVYGDCDNMRIVRIDRGPNGRKRLHLWYDWLPLPAG